MRIPEALLPIVVAFVAACAVYAGAFAVVAIWYTVVTR